ncbi:NADH-quinone oxidoreductase subunit C [Streptomyces sp. NPDC006624]|uniref:NADH-quinone oxidoreductase subunit C n=1 Tax=Streptomyces sp. NPDC006624 TaxID=3154892 RepID=UPI0033B4ABEC
MNAVGWLPADAGELFGPDATAEESYEVLTVDVPPASWIPALETARDRLGCTYFDWLSAVDEPGAGFRVAAHVAALSPLRRLLLRTTVPHEAAALPSAVAVYAGAAWHERETHEMFGIIFEGHPGLDHLLLPDNFEGHPLRKDFVLAARVAKAWPGAKEPGESEHGGPKRRQMLPPGVPDPNEWGPLKGQLPPAPARPARGAARAAGDRPARAARPSGERPVRRTRSASEGSASQTAAAASGTRTERGTETGTETEGAAVEPRATGPTTTTNSTPSPTSTSASASAAEGALSATEAQPPAADTGSQADEAGTASPSAGPRRARSASEGSASQRTRPSDTSAGPRRARSASEGSTSQRAATGPGESRSGGDAAGAETGDEPARPSRTPRSSDAPWHHARPAFDDSAERAEAAEAAQAAEAADSREDAEPGAAKEPSEGTGPTKATKPRKPTEPADSSEEQAPTAPPAPRDQADPEDPEDPAGGPQ